MSATSSESHPRPNFIVIGAGKSGTTWIYRLLKQHPEVFLASVKETLFFADEYARGVGWYEAFFRGSEGRRVVGEVSNTYIYYPGTAVRIHAYRPDMKLIATLRNPVDRTLSHYVWLLRNAQERGTFEEVIERRPDLLERGLYGRHLTEYLRHFDRERLLVLLFDDLRRDPQVFASALFDFLGIEPHFPDNAFERALPASAPRSRLLARLVKKTALAVRGLGFPSLVNKVKEGILPKLLYRPLARDEYPVLQPATRERLNAYFREDVRTLSAIVGRDLVTEWKM